MKDLHQIFFADQFNRKELSIRDYHEPSIDFSEENFEKIEQLLHLQSVLLLQERIKVFFTHQKLLRQCHLDKNQRRKLIFRAIQCNEHLIETI